MASWIRCQTDLPDHPKIKKFRALTGWNLKESIGAFVLFWRWIALYSEDGFIEKFTPEEIGLSISDDKDEGLLFYRSAVSCGLIDESPRRVHDWLDFFGMYLQNKYRGSRSDRLALIKKSWDAILNPNGQKILNGTVKKEDIPKVKQKENAKKKKLGDDSAPPRKKSNQQMILEYFAKIRELDFTNRASQKLICRANGEAASELDDLCNGDLRLALYFIEVAHKFRIDQLSKMSSEQGKEMQYLHLASLLKAWPEFGAVWSRHSKIDQEETLNEFEPKIQYMRGGIHEHAEGSIGDVPTEGTGEERAVEQVPQL